MAQRLKDLISYLLDTGYYYLTFDTSDGYRRCDSDGWFEVAFYIADDFGNSIYIDTYVGYDSEEQEEWFNRNENIELNELMFYIRYSSTLNFAIERLEDEINKIRTTASEFADILI